MQTTFVGICYVATFGGIGLLTSLMFRRARQLADKVPPEDRPWT
jgi:hypothetical protein